MGCDQETVRLAEKIILPGDHDRLGCVTQIRVRATCQRDEFSLCTSKFESDMPSRMGRAEEKAGIVWHRRRAVRRVPANSAKAAEIPPSRLTGHLQVAQANW